jgi:hypothetical protein
MRDNQYFLPQGEAPSSHILKFELADYRHLPAYETFTTQLAAVISLPVVDITLRSIGRTRYVQIARYDRVEDERGEVQRLHQEDFCQALGYGHEMKYQEHGGPSFAQCCRLVQEASSEPAIDVQHLLRWQIFNVLAGNSGGHAKNLSLLHLPGDATRLAPFYDLVPSNASTTISPSMSAESAIPVQARQTTGRRLPGNVMCGRNSYTIWYERPRPLCRRNSARCGKNSRHATAPIRRCNASKRSLLLSAGGARSSCRDTAIKGRDQAPNPAIPMRLDDRLAEDTAGD